MNHGMEIPASHAPREMSFTLIFLACMILAHACFQLYDGMADDQKSRQETPWVPITATITQSDSVVHNGSHCDKVNIDYRYRSTIYHSQVVFSPTCEMAYPDIDYLAVVKNHYPVGHEYAVLINPAHPAESRDPSFQVQTPSFRLMFFSAFVLFGLGLLPLLLGLGLIQVPVDKSRRAEDPLLEEFWHSPNLR